MVIVGDGELLSRDQGYVTTKYNPALSDLIYQVSQDLPPFPPGTPFYQPGQPSDPLQPHPGRIQDRILVSADTLMHGGQEDNQVTLDISNM